jgi:hypothetical protein
MRSICQRTRFTTTGNSALVVTMLSGLLHYRSFTTNSRNAAVNVCFAAATVRKPALDGGTAARNSRSTARSFPTPARDGGTAATNVRCAARSGCVAAKAGWNTARNGRATARGGRNTARSGGTTARRGRSAARNGWTAARDCKTFAIEHFRQFVPFFPVGHPTGVSGKPTNQNRGNSK